VKITTTTSVRTNEPEVHILQRYERVTTPPATTSSLTSSTYNNFFEKVASKEESIKINFCS
jgi:hypothetical protein